MPYSTEEETPVGVLSKADKLQRFKDWLKLSSDAEDSQRVREREDLRFQVAENQWSEEAKKERAGRPCLSISLLHQPLQLVQNQAANARLGVTLTPVNETASDELAEIKQGLYQRIQRDGQADLARLWALDRAKQCGRGWYRVNTKWDEDSDNPSDQEITYERILHQEMVYPDPASTRPDFSDGRFIFVAAYMPCDTFKQMFPKAKNNNREDFAGLLRDAPEWVRANGKAIDPLVAECFYKEIKTETVTLETREGNTWTREREVVTVWRAVLSGCEIVDDQPWLGGGIYYLPIIPVIGRELQPVDGERRWEGMVRPARDGQRTFNYAISSMVEDIGRLSKAPYVGVEGQFEGWEDQWEQVNRRNFPYLQYKNVNLEGKPAPPPQPMQIDGTKMQLSAQLAQEAKSLVQVATAVYEPSLGEVQQGAKGQSGKAIQALQQQADAGTGNYLGNLASISLPCEAKLILNMIPIVYDRVGRVTQVLGGEDESETIMLNQPFVNHPKTGRPVGVPDGLPMPPGAKMYDLSKGKYAVAVSVGKSFQTRLEQGATEMGQILAASPELMPMVGDIYFKFRDFPGAKELSERLAEVREQTMPGLGKGKDGQPTPEAMAAENQALKQQLQLMQQELAKAAEAIKTDRAKQEATIQKAQLDAQSKGQQAEMEASLEERLAQFQAAHQVALENDKQQHAMALEAMKQEFERWKVEFESAHEVAMAAAGANTMTRTVDRGLSDEREDGMEQSAGESRENSREDKKEPTGNRES